ncbi:MAG: response regulator [Acidimicrobiia bacterium]
MSEPAPNPVEQLAQVDIEGLRGELGQARLRLAEVESQKELAEAGSEAKSRFLAHMSHEIRTQLSGILGMTQVAMDTRLTPDQREYLELVSASGEALMTLVNDLLDLRKIEAGRLELDDIPFSVRDTLADAVAVFTPRADEKGLVLTLDLASGMPDYVSGDPGRLRQIISNLVSNAIKFTEEGSVTVRVTADLGDETADFTFIVEDTGIGISGEDLAQLFDEYAQGSRGTARLYGGSGLGLAISRQLVERMGGQISVESAPVGGSRFRVEVPLGLSVPPVPEPKLQRERGIEGLPVLVVADSDLNRVTIRGMLRNSDLAVTTASSHTECLEGLSEARDRDAPYAAVILDTRGDPLAGAEQIRNKPEHDGTHVIVITAVGQRGDGARCRELRVAGYLTKPVKGKELEEAVNAVLGGALPIDLTTLVTRHWLRERRSRLDILVVDDSPTNRMSAKRMLETRGHSVFLVVTGQEAIEALDAFRFDLVLMDLGLPGLNGVEATRQIRSTEDNAHTPIIATTTDDIASVESQCTQAGMDAVVSKPFEPGELTRAIEDAVAAS